MNQYFSAKYGLFTCYDAKVKWGLINIDPGLIERWEKKEKLKKTWNLAIMSSITGKLVTWEQMEAYRKPYTKSKYYKKILKRRGDHDNSLRLLRAKAYSNN